MFKSNKICALLDIQYPIIQGGMAWSTDSKLACAVSDAGGLGIIGCGERNTCFRRQAGLEQIIKRGCKNAFVPIENSKARVAYLNYLQSLGFNTSSFIRILW